MKRTSKKREGIKKFVKRYWLLVVGLLVLIGIFAAGNIWYIHVKNVEYTKANEESARALAELDAKIIEIQQRKIAEAEAAKEAKRITDAKEVAEQAINNGESGASAIDSKLCNSSSTRNDPSKIDVLVNKKHCIQPLDFVPELATSNGATLSVKAIDAYNQLFLAAVAAGQPFYVTSSYRSYATQVSTYRHWVATSGQAAADTYSARPGYSEHQTGLVFDVAANGCALDCFGSTSQYTWFQQNAANYGFIQRYYAGYEEITGYKAEEWHYRYVGVAVAKDMQVKGIKTLERYWNMPGGNY